MTMNVTEHNISDWELSNSEIEEIIRLTKLEMKKYPEDKETQMFYGMIVGKLMIMKNNEDN